ncbi:MAG: hypothetical protein GX241_07615 [Ruminococcaceae bacterium]|nr:hypothetical protein [Oscillospiraceae bacterium]
MSKKVEKVGLYIIEYWLDGRLEVDKIKANSEEEAKQELLYGYKDEAIKRIKFVSIMRR